MSTAPAGPPPEPGEAEIEALLPVLRRVVGARVGGHPAAEDLVQETVVRVLAARDRIEPGMLEPYAVATAKNVVASMWRQDDRAARNQHRLHDPSGPTEAEEVVIASEEARAMATALDRLDDSDRQLLLAHDVGGRPTRSLAEEGSSTAGAVAAQLKRTRARLRVEYLLALGGIDPPTDRCRAVLLALSGADRRRQSELDVPRHLLECAVCAGLSGPLLERGPDRPEEVRVPVSVEADIVTARQAARELAATAGLAGADLTLLATAVSEIARNILRFAGDGEITVEIVDRPRRGIRVVARDTGPGIADVGQALRDGWSTDEGLGLGLPGARRLVDDFRITSEVGRGTTVSMTTWIERG